MSHIANQQENYLRPDKGIRITFMKDRVRKSFNEPLTVGRPDTRQTRFEKELRAYQWFQEKKWSHVPSLLQSSKQGRWIEIERIDGKSIHELLIENHPFDVNATVKQLVVLNGLALQSHISIRGVTPKDVIMDLEGNIWLIDFEETDLNHKIPDHLLYSFFWNLKARWNHSYKESVGKSPLKKALTQAIARNLRSHPFHVISLLKTFLTFKRRELHCWISNKPY